MNHWSVSIPIHMLLSICCYHCYYSSNGSFTTPICQTPIHVSFRAPPFLPLLSKEYKGNFSSPGTIQSNISPLLLRVSIPQETVFAEPKESITSDTASTIGAVTSHGRWRSYVAALTSPRCTNYNAASCQTRRTTAQHLPLEMKSGPAAKTRDDADARRRTRRTWRMGHILETSNIYLVAKRWRCDDIVWASWCLWYVGCLGIWLMLLEDKGIMADCWYLKSSNRSGLWFRYLLAIEDIGNLYCHEMNHQRREAHWKILWLWRVSLIFSVEPLPQVYLNGLMILIWFFLVKWEIVQAAWDMFRLTWWFTSISLFNSLRVLELFIANAKAARPDSTNCFGAVLFSRWKRSSQDGIYLFCLIHETYQCKKGVA